jgi:hypothetical protein
MASDYPFSVTSKYTGPDGAEHLVTVRAPTVDQFRQHLADAATVFPRAGFAPATGAAAPPAPATATADPQAPVNIAQARRQVEVAEQVQGATANVREQREATDHVCPDHGVAKASRYNGGSYCPTKLDDGSYCKWVWPAAKRKAA